MKLKYLLLLLLALLGSTTLWADIVRIEETHDYTEVDGIYYEFYDDNKTAAVTCASYTYAYDILDGVITGNWEEYYSSDYSGDVVIPDSVTFNGTTYRVTYIAQSAFNECIDLTSVTIPESVTGIGVEAFHYCTSLTSVTIPNSVTSIGAGAFRVCSGLTSVTIPNSVTSIGKMAFYFCFGLTSFTIPESVTSIDDYAFGYCYFRTDKFINNSALTSDTNWGATLCDEETSEGLLIKDNVVVRCRPWATSVTIPNSVTSIGDYAFAYCLRLTSVTIGNGVISIGKYAFENSSSLTDVWCYAESLPSTYLAFIYSSISSATLHVPAASIEAYSTTEPWSGFGSIVAIDDGSNIIEDLSELSNNKQYLIHTRDKIRGSLGVIDNHLASNNPTATGPWVCRPVVLDESNPLITNVSQLSSPYTEPTEGSLAAMIDGNTGTFWHSTWTGGAVENGLHYFQVEILNQANIDVAFKVTRRQIYSDNITEWGVYGTNNANATKAECAPLAVIETPYNYMGETRVSDIFNTGGYKYLRFYINNTSSSRGFGHLAEFQLYPAIYDETRDASPFAIIQKNDGYYLYSVRDKAFITSVNDGDENAHPLCPNDNKMNIYKHDDHFVFSFAETNYTINVNNNGVVINDNGKINGEYNEGNLFTIEEVGDFEPTEALAMFEMQTFTVTYEVLFNAQVVATATEEVASGDNLPPVPASLYNDFITLKKYGNHPTKITKNVTVQYKAQWNGPFEFAKTEADAKWYNMHIRSGYYVGKQDTEPYIPTKDVNEATLATPAYQWAFGGDPYHLKVYNRTTGLSETLTEDSVNAVMRSGDYTWDLLPNNDGFVLRVTGTENSCINHYGYGPLQFWTDSRSLTNDGSTFRVVEAIEPSSLISFADPKVEKLCIDNWDTNKSGALSKAEAAAVTDLDEVFKGNTSITSFNELQYFTGLEAIGNSAFRGCTSLASITLPEGLKSIGISAFQKCSGLTELTIPENVTSIGKYAFLNCSGLKEIYCNAKETPDVADNAFGGVDVSNVLLVVPDNSLEAYKAHPVWRKFWVETPTPIASPFGETEEGAEIYNLAGQRLSKMQRGINIVGGKAILVK